jgi:LysM domain
MKNRISLIISLILFAFAVNAQSLPLTIEGASGKFYLVHTVVAKENWYSIGRLFNQGPHEIASFNNMNFDKPLEVGTMLNIPLTAVNFDQKDLKLPGETLIPIYHVVGEKEWMFKISSVYNDVPVTSLEKWNKIKRDDVKKGISLIVGFLKVKTDQSPLALGVPVNPATGATAVQTNPATISTQNSPKKDVTTVTNSNSTTTTIIPVSNPSDHVNNYAATHSNGGYFSADYTGIGKTASGIAGTFKSTSGWSDGKYYALMNGIPVGTIIRVSGTNGKTIYAKVLGQLPEMKESNGLIIRISNAASAELGLGEGKFPVDVKY